MTDLSALSDDQILAAAGIANPISSAILGQESGNKANASTSIDGAVGRGQIIPSTFAQYAKPGEDINNDADNLAVHNRIIDDLSQKTGGDPARIAVGYFSGPGNIAGPDSPTPWKQDRIDGNGKKVSSYVSDVIGRLPKQPSNDSQSSDLSNLSDDELLQAIGQTKDKVYTGEDVAKSAIYRGIPEGLAASTIGGFGLNAVRGVSDLTRWAAGKAYKAIEGEDLPHYTNNPVPTSSDVLQAASKGILGQDLYEPKTTAGQYANSIAQFAFGGKATGIPLTATIPAAVASEAAGQATAGSEYEPAARILGAALGGRAALSSKTPTLTADETRAAASAKYKSLQDRGAGLSSDITDNLLNDIDSNKPKTTAGQLLSSGNPLSALAKKLAPKRGQPLSLEEAQEIDEHLGDLIDAHSENGVVNKLGKKLLDVQKNFRSSIENADDSQLTGDKSAFSDLKDARALWAKSARLSDVERIVKKGMDTDNPATSIRKGFANLKNSSKFKQYNADEQASIKQAAKTGILSKSLYLVGNPLVTALLGIGEDINSGGLTGGVTGYAIGKGLQNTVKSARTGLQQSRANNALNVISSRSATPMPSPLARLAQSNIQIKPRIRVRAGVNP